MRSKNLAEPSEPGFEAMTEDEEAGERALEAMSDEIRHRFYTPLKEYLDLEKAFDEVRAHLHTQGYCRRTSPPTFGNRDWSAPS